MENKKKKFNIADYDVLINLIEIKINKVAPNYNINKVGRPSKLSIRKTLEYIFMYLVFGITWTNLDNFLIIADSDFTSDCIRKKYAEWIQMNIFDDIHEVLQKDYISRLDIENLQLIIDSTDIQNINGLHDNAGHGRKLKGKYAQKDSIICTQDMIPLAHHINSANEADVKQLDSVLSKVPKEIFDNFSYNNTIPVSADAGYHTKYVDRQRLRTRYGVYINVPNRRNMNRYISEKHQALLRKRYLVEILNQKLKRSYKHYSRVTDRETYRLDVNFYIYTSCLITLLYAERNISFDGVYNYVLDH